MFGGLLKSTSRLALVAAATVVGGISAQAADLGGNCCADLEERVAELEATTARKGNRKVSLTVYGQVNEAVMFWDDGHESNAYIVSNNASRTRFGFRGDARINADWSAGYLLEIGVRYASTTNRTQFANAAGGNSGSFDIRHSAWYLDSKTFGRVWVGQSSTASDGITEINLSNGGTIAGPDVFATWGANGFFLRNSAGGTSALTWANLPSSSTTAVGEGDRNNVVRYISPTFAGFNFQAAWGEDDMWDVALRYAGEFNGIRLAAGVGYRENTDANNGDGMAGCANLSGVATQSATDCSQFGLSGSVMHVPTGLYVAAAYGEETDDNRDALFGVDVNEKSENYYVQAGIEQNWFGFGRTTLYGEYYTGDFGAGLNAGAVRSVAAADAINSVGAARRISGAEVDMWGVGVVQNIDAAAMSLYLSYRNYSADVSLSATGAEAGSVKGNAIEDWQAVIAGGIIRF